MLRKNSLGYLLICWCLLHWHQAESRPEEWNYVNSAEWDNEYAECHNKRQSPISLSIQISNHTYISPLIFSYYDEQLSDPLILINNGHTVEMQIPVTVSGLKPDISGSILSNHFEALSLHFHWGSPHFKGSEHSINNQFFDAEMHIVHKNIKYATIEEAKQHADGLAVFGIMFKVVDHETYTYPALDELFSKLPLLIKYRSQVEIVGTYKLNDFLANVNTNEFFTYNGSLTTPPCSEAVIWHVFPTAIAIQFEKLEAFWHLNNAHNTPLVNNYRQLQPMGNRTVFYRSRSGGKY